MSKRMFGALLILIGLVAFTLAARAQQQDLREYEVALKAQQKLERNALEAQTRSLKQTMKEQRLPSRERRQMLRQMKQDKRTLLRGQKVARQDLKRSKRYNKAHRNDPSALF